jgi:phospholipid transport system substrate-binding protein
VFVPPLHAGQKAPKGSAASQPATRAVATKGKAATPDDIVRSKWPATISILQNKNLDQAAKEKEIEKIVTPIIDFLLMAKLALGKAHWTRLTPSQRERYLPLFVERIKRSYREKIALYEGEKILAKFPPPGTSAKKGRSGKIVHIPVELTTKARKAIVLHKFRKVDSRWKLYDVEIEGVSILQTYRSQFNDILRTGTVDDLLGRLAKEPPR